MEISAEELDRAIKLGKQRERNNCLAVVQDQIDLALGQGDHALAGALSAAKAEIALGVGSSLGVVPTRMPEAGRDPVDEPLTGVAAALESQRGIPRDGLDGLVDGFAPARERNDDLEGVTIAQHLLSRRR